MNLLLLRDKFTDTCTLGQLFVDSHYECETIEDTVREIPGVPVKEWKIKGKTAIPVGKYQVFITFSNRFQKYLPELQDVPGFTGIRIHAGNTSADTEGCLLVGEMRNDLSILHSRPALEALQNKIEHAISKGDKVFIEVT